MRRHEEILEKYDLPISVQTEKIGFQCEELRAECMRNIMKDKKRKGSKLRFVLPSAIGKTEVRSDIIDDMIEKAFQYLIRGKSNG